MYRYDHWKVPHGTWTIHCSSRSPSVYSQCEDVPGWKSGAFRHLARCPVTRSSEVSFGRLSYHERLDGEACGVGCWVLLRKVLGQSRLTGEQLNNTLISIEAAVNSKTIKQSGDSDYLTPNQSLDYKMSMSMAPSMTPWHYLNQSKNTLVNPIWTI